MPSQTVKNILKAKKINLPQMNFFLKKQTTNKIFMYPLALFILQNFEKILRANPELWDVPFSCPKWSICPKQFFLVLTIIITFIYLLALSTVQNLKKLLQQIESYEDVPFLAPKCSICTKQRFCGKLLKSFSSTY